MSGSRDDRALGSPGAGSPNSAAPPAGVRLIHGPDQRTGSAHPPAWGRPSNHNPGWTR